MMHRQQNPVALSFLSMDLTRSEWKGLLDIAPSLTTPEPFPI